MSTKPPPIELNEPVAAHPGATLPDPSNGQDWINGTRNPDMLISDSGKDVLLGKGGVDSYVINNTNYERVVTIKDCGINRLIIDGGNNIMELDIQTDAVLLNGKPLQKAGNAFKLQIDNLTLLIEPDYDISHQTAVQKPEAAITNPILENMPNNISLASKLAVLNQMHALLQQQQTPQPQVDPMKEADKQFV